MALMVALLPSVITPAGVTDGLSVSVADLQGLASPVVARVLSLANPAGLASRGRLDRGEAWPTLAG
jgi:hypothetical protein